MDETEELELAIISTLFFSGTLSSNKLIKQIEYIKKYSKNSIIRALKRLTRSYAIFREPSNWAIKKSVWYGIFDKIDIIRQMRHDELGIPLIPGSYKPIDLPPSRPIFVYISVKSMTRARNIGKILANY